jgi:hypothetical protein
MSGISGKVKPELCPYRDELYSPKWVEVNESTYCIPADKLAVRKMFEEPTNEVEEAVHNLIRTHDEECKLFWKPKSY